MDTIYSTAFVNRQDYAKSGYGFLTRILDNLDYEPVVRRLSEYRRRGRRGYSPGSMLRLTFLKYLLNIRTDVDLLERLRLDGKARQICGFDDQLPTLSTLSRFRKRLLNHLDLLDRCRISLLAQVRQFLPDLGNMLAIDSTDISSYANGKRKLENRSDQDARWGVKHSSKSEKKETIDFFGFKAHVMADGKYGLPLSYTVTPGSRNDTQELPIVLKKTLKEHPWIKAKYLLADRGYDSQPNHKFVDGKKIIPIIHIRKPTAEDGLYDGLYDKKGRPVCLGQVPMAYVASDPDSGRHLFQCPVGGCDLKGVGLVPNCQDSLWVNPEDNLRVISRVHRSTPAWKALYSNRTSIERLFGSLKQSRKLDNHTVCGMEPMKLHVALSMVSYLGTALAHLQMEDAPRLRRMSLRLG